MFEFGVGRRRLPRRSVCGGGLSVGRLLHEASANAGRQAGYNSRCLPQGRSFRGKGLAALA
jgi:hypothetical protein